jgi:hypothetical protein
MARLLADENFNNQIVRGVLRQSPDIDIVRVQDVDLSGVDDPTVLEWAGSGATTDSECFWAGNVLYGPVVQKVAVAGFVAQDYWQNFKLLLMSNQPEEAIEAGIQYLANLLVSANQPLTDNDKTAWNVLVQKYDLDQGCLLI